MRGLRCYMMLRSEVLHLCSPYDGGVGERHTNTPGRQCQRLKRESEGFVFCQLDPGKSMKRPLL